MLTYWIHYFGKVLLHLFPVAMFKKVKVNLRKYCCISYNPFCHFKQARYLFSLLDSVPTQKQDNYSWKLLFIFFPSSVWLDLSYLSSTKMMGYFFNQTVSFFVSPPPKKKKLNLPPWSMTCLLNDNVFKTTHLSVCSYHPTPFKKKNAKEKLHPPTEKNDWKNVCFFLNQTSVFS